MIAVGDRVRIHRPHTTLHHRTGDDGILVEPPLLLSDLQVIRPSGPV